MSPRNPPSNLFAEQFGEQPYPSDIRIPEPAFDFGHFLVVGDRVVLLGKHAQPVYRAVGIDALLNSRPTPPAPLTTQRRITA